MRFLNVYLILVFLLSSCATRQELGQSASTKDNYPEFPGEEKELRKYLIDHITYPSEMLEKDETASMLAVCRIGTDGVLKDISILNGWDENVGETVFAEEVRKVLSDMTLSIPSGDKYTSETFFCYTLLF
ncbi:MAG: hypothetical protein LIP01_08170 [Tannerellaceae bacterium]|nr:hypothetical protein [Tannerellaceae bacterium]